MTETQSFYGNKVLELLPGQPSLRYPATKEERREAALEWLDEEIYGKLIDLILGIEKSDLGEEALKLLNYERKDLVERIDKILHSEYLKG